MAVNNADNVFAAKGVQGGYFFSCERPSGENGCDSIINSLKDFSKSLNDDANFANLGFIPEDGVTVAESSDTNTDNDMNGDPINTSRSARTETLQVTLVEQKADSLKEVYGHNNVTDEGGLITVHHNNADRTHRLYVLDLVGKPTAKFPNGRRWREIVPDGQVTEVGDMTINSSTLVGRQLTISCSAYTYGTGDAAMTDTMIDFMESEESGSASSGGGSNSGGSGSGD